MSLQSKSGQSSYLAVETVALETLSICAYDLLMSTPLVPALDQIKADLAESEADIAAGRLIPGDVVHQMMQDRIDRLEARLAGTPTRKIAPVRR
jgi:hypothetical protein